MSNAWAIFSGCFGGWSIHRIRMRRSLAKFSESEASNQTPSLADFITTTSELRFSVHAAARSRLWRRNLSSSPFHRHSRNHPAWQEKKNRRKNAVDHSWNDEALARAKTAPTRPGGVTRI